MFYQTRNLLDVRVGKSHTIQILFNLRQRDVPWFNDNAETYTKQLLKLLSDEILPIECKDEIEDKRKGRDGLFEKKKGKKNNNLTRLASKGVKRKHVNAMNDTSGGSNKRGSTKQSKNKQNNKEQSIQTKKQGRNMNSKKKHSEDESSSTNATSSPPSSHLSSTIFNSENTFLLE